MSQLNIHLSPGFEKALKKFMLLRGIKNKSQAVRLALEESLNRSLKRQTTYDFTRWLGAGLRAPVNPQSKFGSDDDLWK
ncbi:MAG TPA: hypothetical protein VI895_02900 [Bdellovibrionota bacterium]|nr:hypothetical protein [Bdellovibrionota bacterium]